MLFILVLKNNPQAQPEAPVFTIPNPFQKALSTGAVRVVTTNEKGLFYAPVLRPDDYELTTQASGFATVTQSLHLEVGQKLAIDVSLKIGPVTEGVHVTASADVLRTTDASVGEVVEPKSIQELPLNGRMLLDLVLTIPGTHVGFGAQTGETNPLYWLPVSVPPS